MDVLNFAHAYWQTRSTNFGYCDAHLNSAPLAVLSRLGVRPASICKVDYVFEPINHYIKQCPSCGTLATWQEEVEAKIENLSKFSTFL